MITIDFETEAIEGNVSRFPPKPVGVALKLSGQPGQYLAWGHPTGNNCTEERAKSAVANAYTGVFGDVLCHNAKFDHAVAQAWMGAEIDPKRLHDTQYLLFLNDPHSTNLSLKPSAARLLNMPPDEQDELHDWILANVPGATKKTAGAYICKAPGDLTGRYAIGDVDRTEGLYDLLAPKILDAYMEPAYRREQLLLPVLMKAERNGVRVGLERLHHDLEKYEHVLVRIENDMRRLLGDDSVDFDKDVQVADAVERAGMAGTWVLTPTGRRSTAKGALEQGIAHPTLRNLLRYRGALSTCLSTFMRPWHAMATANNGRMHPNWNQVRQARGDKGNTAGTRTGRVSCDSPNYTNVPNEFDFDIPPGYPELPHMKQYLLPEEGCVWLKRDYSQQELRILAHYAEGTMLEQYQQAPDTDFHDLARELIKQNAGIDLPRKYVKITAFSIIYGAGAATMAERMGTSVAEAHEVRNAYLKTFPGIRTLQNELTYRGRNNLPMRTWGGRMYFSEPSGIDPKTGKYREYHYKLLNYLIQGSAADCTKEALINYDQIKRHGTFLTTVYDEINICAPKEHAASEMALLREAMLSPAFDVPMLSDGYIGPNWADLEDYV